MDQDKTHSFQQIYDTHAKEIFRFALLKLSDHAQAEDLAAETFLKYWKKHLDDEVIENPRAFLYFIAHRLVVDTYRKRSVRHDIAIDALGEEILSVENVTMDDLDRTAEFVAMRTAMERLKEEYREILELHYLQELSIAEIAAILGETTNNLRVRLHRAILALRKLTNHER